jgi:hypothetical protein
MNPSELPAFGFAMLRHWTSIGEAMSASSSVVRRRSELIGNAVRNPFKADTRELSRMVPEKISAFSHAGASLVGDMVRMQSLVMDQLHDLTNLAFSGAIPSFADFRRVNERGTKIASIAVYASVRAFQPIHETVTANEKRLG